MTAECCCFCVFRALQYLHLQYLSYSLFIVPLSHVRIGNWHVLVQALCFSDSLSSVYSIHNGCVMCYLEKLIA